MKFSTGGTEHGDQHPRTEHQPGDIGQRSNATKGLGSRTGEYAEIFYDKSTGDVWCKYHWDREEWTVYHDDDVTKVGLAVRYKTQQQIADMIASTLTQEGAVGA